MAASTRVLEPDVLLYQAIGGTLWMVYSKQHLGAIASCIVLLFVAVMDHDLLPHRARPVLLTAGLVALVGLAWRNMQPPEDSTKP